MYAALTGDQASFGNATVQGVKLAAEEINAAGGILGRRVRLVIEDDQGRPDQAASVVTKLITSDNVVAVIGENSSNNSLAAAPICQANKVPMISPSSTNPAVTEKGEYIFRVCFTDPYQGKALAFFVKNNLKSDTAAVLIDKKNDYSVGLAQFFEKEFEALGGKITGQQSYSGGDTEFRPQLTALKQGKPQVLFVPGFYTEVGQIAIQARDLGINIPMVGGDGWDSPTVIEIGGKSIDGSYFSDHYFVGDPRPLVQQFVSKIKERHGKNPEANAALGYDALKIFAAAATRAGSFDTAKVRDQIAATKNYDGVSGMITMGADRNPQKPVAMIKIENGAMGFAGWVNPSESAPAGPQAVLQQLYERHQPQYDKGLDFNEADQLKPYFSAELVELFRKDSECEERTKELCNLDFDPVFAAQDYDESKPDLAIEPLGPDRYKVTFTNLGRRSLVYRVAQSGNEWRVSDIEYPEGGTLTSILRN